MITVRFRADLLLVAVCGLWIVAGGLLLISCSVPAGTGTAAGVPEEDTEPEAGPTAEILPTPTLTPGLTVLTFWEPYPIERPEGALMVELVHDFEAQTPGIRVEIVPHGGALGVQDALAVALAEGESLPDVAIAFPSTIAQLATAGLIVPLDSYVADPEIGIGETAWADLCASCIEAGRLPRFDGQLLAFPFAQNVIGMWVNDSLLAAAGWNRPPVTWAEFEQACYDVHAQTGARCLPFIESVSSFNAWLYSRGGHELADNGRHAAFQGPAGVDSLTLLRRLIDAGLAWRPAEEYGDYLAFAQGEAAFAFASSGTRRLYTEAYQQAVSRGMAPFNWHQALIPQADPEHPATILYGTSFFVVHSDPARQEAAWRLIRWFAEPGPAARWSAGLDALPIRASSLDLMTGTLQAYPFLRGQVEDILPYAVPEPAVPKALQIREILYTALLSVTQGTADPQAALERAASQVDVLLAGEE